MHAEHPAICIVGPPDAGKTALVSTWIEVRRCRGIWYQVDAGDHDLPTFLHSLALAAAPYLTRRARPLTRLTHAYFEDLEGFSRSSFRQLF